METTDEMATDYDDIFIFTLPSAQTFTFTFNHHNLVIDNCAYNIADGSDSEL